MVYKSKSFHVKGHPVYPAECIPLQLRFHQVARMALLSAKADRD